MLKGKLIGSRYRHLGEYLREKRLEAGLSQLQVADELDLTTPQFISMIERGKKQLPVNLIPVFLELYGMPPRELIDMMREEQLRLYDIKLRKVLPNPK